MNTSPKDFKKWYVEQNWSSMSTYEIASFAWHEAAKRWQNNSSNLDDDHFSWWFDDQDPALMTILTDKAIAHRAWDRAVKVHLQSI